MAADAHSILPRRFGLTSICAFPTNEVIERHALPRKIALSGETKAFHALLNVPTPQALSYIERIARKRAQDPELPDLIKAHRVHFPDRYSLPDSIGLLIARQVIDICFQYKETTAITGQTFDFGPSKAIVDAIVSTGVNLAAFAAIACVTPSELHHYLKLSPRKAQTDVGGWSLYHQFCMQDGFFDTALPALRKARISPNSVSENPAIGTFLHVLIANELHDQAIRALRELTGSFNPALTDGERKTLAVAAAKARAEEALLEMADLYPETSLALDAQDEHGRTVMHYCFGLGLINASRKLAGLGADLAKQDHQGRTPVDYLNLAPQEIREILLSIEVHPDRDAGAWHNAIRLDRNGQSVLVNNRPVLATRENFTDTVFAVAERQAPKEGRKTVQAQLSALKDCSVLDEVIKNRDIIRQELDSGRLAPVSSQAPMATLDQRPTVA
jgi:hypothetical protein